MNTKDVMVPCILLLQKDGKNPLALSDTVEPVKAEKKEDKKEDDKEPAKKPEEKKPGTPGIDLEGLYDRLILIPGMSGSYTQIAQAGSRVLVSGAGKISFYDLKAKKAGEVTSGGAFSLSADGKKLLVGNRVVDAAGTGVAATAGAVSFGGLQLRIEPKQEWEQMFWDAWRLLRDYFYVANMHGLDWKEIGNKYHAMLPQVRSRDELDILIKWMQAELGSSHQYLRGGDEQLLTKTARGGHLGIEVVPEGGHLKISKIYSGDGMLTSERSPLLEAGMNVSEGNYLLAIGGQKLTASSNYKEHLVGRAGQTVSVKIGKTADDKEAKTYFVKPVSSEARMKQLSWVEKNRAYVDKASDGRIGYIYLRAMSTPDMADFIKQFYPLRDKQALLIDTRFNGGGNTQAVMNRILNEKLVGMFNMRASEYGWSRQSDFFLGPLACLQNEFNVSCGEEFPHAFRKLGLGKVIGRRTYGGEVGSSPGWPLADGGVVSVPNYGMYTIEDGWVIEGPGVSPDIDVESDPNAYARGTDPQLDASVKHLLAEIKANPIKYPMEPPAKIQRRRRG
jgi:tricorn protease